MMTDSTSGTQAPINKVAEVGLVFWLIKMLSTTMGETGADYLIFKLHWGLWLTSAFMGVFLVVTLVAQLRSNNFHQWLYWLTVVMVSIFGTLITDNLTDHLHVPLWLSSLAFSVLLMATFYIWFRQEQTLSIAEIDNPRREIFYWLAILTTFALGTAVGDWVAEDMNWGYKLAAYIFGGLIALTAIARFGFQANAVLCFWIAYILTRPLGASVGDFLSHSAKKGGMGFGVTNTSLVFLVIIVLLVAYLTRHDKKVAEKIEQ
jgi:uncharacterized membrane-anchored protein